MLSQPTDPTSRLTSTTPPPRSRAERIRARRLEAGWSQFTLAGKAGISLQTMGLVERGGICTPATAAKLAQAFGVEPSAL